MAKGQQRDPKKEAFWRGVLGRFAKGGLSVRAFCRREMVTESAFYAWRRVVQERGAERLVASRAERRLVASRAERRHVRPPTRKLRATVPAFVPLVVRDEQVPAASGLSRAMPSGLSRAVPSGRITVELRGGRVLRLGATVTAQRLAELVCAVESVAVGGAGTVCVPRNTGEVRRGVERQP